mgnify:CR=1 FL=1
METTLTMPYFSRGSRARAIATAVDAWEGTPWCWGQAVKQGGADCIRMVDAILTEAGWAHSATWPEAYYDRGANALSELLLSHFRDCGEYQEIALDDRLQAGDVLLLRTGQSPWHSAIMRDPIRLLSMLRGGAATVGQVDDPTYRKRLHSVWRPLTLT